MLRILILVTLLQVLLNDNIQFANGQIKLDITKYANSKNLNKIDSPKPYASIENFLLNQKPLGNLKLYFFNLTLIYLINFMRKKL